MIPSPPRWCDEKFVADHSVAGFSFMKNPPCFRNGGRRALALLFLPRFPDGQKFLSEDGKLDEVPILPVSENLLAKSALLVIPTLFAVGNTPLVERNHLRADFAEIQSVESIVEQQYFRFRAKASAPEFLLSDHCTGNSRAVSPIDAMKSHVANVLPLNGFNCENDIVGFTLGEIFYPLLLFSFLHRQIGFKVIPDLWIVNPLKQSGQV